MMTEQAVNTLIIKMAVPSVVIMLVSAIYNLTASYFVSYLGTSALAAIGVSFPVQAVIQAIGFFFGQGSGNFISRALGARENSKAENMAATGFFSAFIAGLLIAIFGLLFLTPLAKALGSTETILPYSKDYLRYILIASPFMVSSFLLNNLLRFQGAANMAMIGIVTGAILNIGFTPLLIFGFNMGMKGAAIATMLSQMTSCAILLFLGRTRNCVVAIRFKNFTHRWSDYSNIVRGGTPSLLRQALLSISTILLNHAAGNFGDSVIAGISIVGRIIMIFAAVVLGIGQGYQPVCGFNWGAKRYDRVRKGFWFTVWVSTVFLSIAAVVGYFFAPELIALFGDNNSEVINIGVHALRFQCYILPFSAYIIVMNMLLQTTGKALPACILALARQGMFLIPLLYIIVPFWDVLGIELCTPISDALTFILTVIMGRRMLRELKMELPINSGQKKMFLF
jgi:putative MATE family efflux protein